MPSNKQRAQVYEQIASEGTIALSRAIEPSEVTLSTNECKYLHKIDLGIYNRLTYRSVAHTAQSDRSVN